MMRVNRADLELLVAAVGAADRFASSSETREGLSSLRRRLLEALRTIPPHGYHLTVGGAVLECAKCGAVTLPGPWQPGASVFCSECGQELVTPWCSFLPVEAAS